MAPSATATSTSPPLGPDTTENSLQPFFVLHKASSRKYEKNATRTTKTRRRIDLSTSLPRNAEKPEIGSTEEFHDDRFMNLQMEAFETVWSKIDSTIKDVLRDINTNVFNEIHQWVSESFNTIRSAGTLTCCEATQPFPIVSDACFKQLFTGFVLTRNMEFVDDLLTFEELGLHLKSQGCHVANLSSLDFTAKSGVGGCLRSLLRQFLEDSLDAPDISILASWYREHGNGDNPLVVIVNDIERCSGSVLSDFILILSEWVLKIPVVLIMGVTTTLDAPRNILPSNLLHTTPDAPRNILPSDVLQQLCSCKFTLVTAAERMDAVIEAVLVKHCSGFSVSHRIAAFMRNYFVRQDGTLTSFVRALKIACVQHFSMERLSFVLSGHSIEEDGKDGLLQQEIFEHACNLPSYARNKMGELTGEGFSQGLSNLRRWQSHWGAVLLCLYEAGKHDGIRLLDLLCEALDPEPCNSKLSDAHTKVEQDYAASSQDHMRQVFPPFRRGGFIWRAMRKVRDLSTAQLYKLVKRWEELTADVCEIHGKLKELQTMLHSVDSKVSNKIAADISKRRVSRSQLPIKDTRAVNEKAATLIESMVRNVMVPIECVPLHEIVCFKDEEQLQSALIGDPRRRIQVDLLESNKVLQCSCCTRRGNTLLPTMHDTSIMYNLAQEHGDIINLHDWYQSFKSIVFSSRGKVKNKVRQSPSAKKRKVTNESENQSEAHIQLQGSFGCPPKDGQILYREWPLDCKSVIDESIEPAFV